MLVTIIIFIGCFIWLMIETRCLTIRLPYGATIPVKTIDKEQPYYWLSDEQKDNLTPCINNCHCPYRAKCKKNERWLGVEIPERTIKAFDSTMHFAKQCNIYRALMLKEIADDYKRKSKPAVKAPCQLNITLMGLDSFGEPDNSIEINCLVSKEWLNLHKNDYQDYEPTMELIVDDKSLHVNGNYEKGLISTFMDRKPRKQRKLIEV